MVGDQGPNYDPLGVNENVGTLILPSLKIKFLVLSIKNNLLHKLK